MPRTNMPMKFPGGEDARRTNYLSHYFTGDDGDMRCSDCDCRPWGRLAEWPCGAAVPRVTVEIGV